MHTLKSARIEPLFHVLHRLAQDESLSAGVDAHIVTGSINPLNRIHINPENLPLILDVNELFKAIGGRCIITINNFFMHIGRMLGERFL